MSVDVFKEEFEHIELFNKPALFTNARIQRDSVPQGWFCYDLRGSDDDPGQPVTVENRVVVNHAGTVLLPEEIELDGLPGPYRQIRDGLDFLGESMTLAGFCQEYGLDLPAPTPKYVLRPASPEETGLFFAMPKEQDAELGAIGHLRADFGRGGDRFNHTWHPRGPKELNTLEFKTEFDDLVNELRENGPLKSLSDMRRYCREHGGEIAGGICTQNYGYIIETENYRYALRCNPQPGDHQIYLTAFDLRVQEMNMKQEPSCPEDCREAMDEKTMREFIGNLFGETEPKSAEAWVEYATTLDQDGIENVPDFYRELCGELEYISEKAGVEIARQVFDMGQGFTLNPYELRTAALLLLSGVSVGEISGLAISADLCNPMYRESGSFPNPLPDASPPDAVGRVSFAGGETREYTDALEYVKAVKDELPYANFSDFHYKTLTENPLVRKAVDDLLYDLYGEENPRPLEDYKHTAPSTGMGGISQ